MPDSLKTSLSMLDGMREDDPDQWKRFASLFAPLIYEWCRRSSIQSQDAADITQEVFRAVSERIGSFERRNVSSPFHRWLWGITRHKIQDHFRTLAQRPVGQGGTTAHVMLSQMPTDIPQEWSQAEIENDQGALSRRALELIQTDFKPRTWQAFWRVSVDEANAADVADELQMSVGAVYNARYKVLKRLREEFSDLL
jgi:RNA polymerase sigma-70 factor (ECF subfamily)